jgi:hypothetical protein
LYGSATQPKAEHELEARLLIIQSNKLEQTIQMDQIIDWLLEGDVAIQYQVWRDLLDSEQPQLRERIAAEGWGEHFLSYRHQDGHWGRAFYQPKWTSTHYTLLDLKHLNPPES